jgi:hypothetical protein
MRKKSAIETTPPLSDGRIGDTHVPWVQDMAGTCPRFAFWIYYLFTPTYLSTWLHFKSRS